MELWVRAFTIICLAFAMIYGAWLLLRPPNKTRDLKGMRCIHELSNDFGSMQIRREQCEILSSKCRPLVQPPPDFILKESFCAIVRALKLLQDCCSENWILNAAEFGNRQRHFLEILLDLRRLPIVKTLTGFRGEPLDDMAIAFRSIDISEETKSEIGNAWNLDPTALLRKLMSGSIPGHWRAHQLEAEAKPYLIAPDDIERCVTQFKYLKSDFIYQGDNGICVFRVPFCNKEFVIKARLSKLGAEEQEDIKLRNEATFMKKCRHPYAVALLGYWEFVRTEGLCELTSVPLLLMESMECDLDSIIKGNKSRWWPWGGTGGFPALEAINLVLPVAKVMKYLHGIGVVHLDLKPKNILFTRVPGKRSHPEVVSVKLADFGDARMAEDRLINVDGKFARVGTPGYMHPVVWYQVESVDLFQADIFSFGMVLGEVLTGVSSMEALGCKLGKEFYGKLQGEQVQLPEDTPTSVKSIVENCLKLNPDERPSFAHICRELEEAEIELRNGGPCKHSEVST